jgi:Ala-tRNA(Pro) deacylase
MAVTRDELFAYLDELGIAHSTLEHAPVFTVGEGRDIKSSLPGGHTKNLFLKDKAGRFVLVSALGDTAIRVNRLHKPLDCKRLSFAREEDLIDVLGVRPGSVTAFALMNDVESRVTFVIDAALLATDPVNFHPLKNDATTAIARDDLLAFAKATGHDPLIVDFAALAADD